MVSLHDGGQQQVSSVEDAFRFLMESWPPGHAEQWRYKAAVQRCYATLETRYEANEARKAFMEAAIDAGIFVAEPRNQ